MSPYTFVQNATIGAFDALGLFKIDTAKFTVEVEQNEIVILYGHQHTPSWFFTFNGTCSSAAAIVCYPRRTKDKIQGVHKIHSDIPNHENYMFFYGDGKLPPKLQEKRDQNDPETDGNMWIEKITEWAKAKAQWYCTVAECKCSKINIRFYRDARKINLPAGLPSLPWLQDINFPAKPSDLVYDCTTKKFTVVK